MRMQYMVLADSHLGHRHLVEENIRPAGYEEVLLNNIRSMAETIEPAESLVFICLGDVAFDRAKYWHEELLHCLPSAAKAWLVLGNHDRKRTGWYFDRGWDIVAHRIDMDVFGRRVKLTHIPLPPHELLGDNDLNVHGHLHKGPTHHEECVVGDKHRLIYCEDNLRAFSLRKIVDNWPLKGLE